MSEGYVYILTNEAMPGLVKIGKTTRSVEQRVNELQSTGVPFPFKIYSAFFTPDCHELEADAHLHFPDLRVNDAREFFRCDPQMAADLISDLHVTQLRDWTSRFDEQHVLVREPFYVDEGDLHRLASDAGVDVYSIAQVIGLLEPEDLKGAVSRYNEKCRLRKMRLDAGIGLGSLDPSDIAAEIDAAKALKVVS